MYIGLKSLNFQKSKLFFWIENYDWLSFIVILVGGIVTMFLMVGLQSYRASTVVFLSYMAAWGIFCLFLQYFNKKHCFSKSYLDSGFLGIIKVNESGKVIEATNGHYVRLGAATEKNYKILCCTTWTDWPERKESVVLRLRIEGKKGFLTTSLPVQVGIELIGDFDPQEIYDQAVLADQLAGQKDFTDKESINLNALLKRIFFNDNEDAIEEIGILAANFDGRADQNNQLNRILGFLTFPKNSFSNFGRVTISIDPPEIKACREINSNEEQPG